MWSSDDALASDLAQSATKSAEKIWRMPLTKEYKEHTKSTIADLTNCGPREGGAITAALFLNVIHTPPLSQTYLPAYIYIYDPVYC